MTKKQTNKMENKNSIYLDYLTSVMTNLKQHVMGDEETDKIIADISQSVDSLISHTNNKLNKNITFRDKYTIDFL